MINNKTYIMLSEEEIAAEAKLTPRQEALVNCVLAAVKALPRDFCLEVDDEGFHVMKRITRGSTHGVGSVKRASLHF